MNKKKGFWSLLVLLIVGCGILETREKETAAYDGEIFEQDGCADLKGWIFDGDKQQYLEEIWGIWSINMVSSDGNYGEYWGTYELSPDSASFRSEIVDVDDSFIEVEQYNISPVLTRYRSTDSWFKLTGNYFLQVEVNGEAPTPLTEMFLVNENCMVGYSGRTLFLLEKIEEHEEIEENRCFDFVPTDHGFWCGEWEVMGSLKVNRGDSEQYIGMHFDTSSMDSERKKIIGVYPIAVEEESIGKLVEAMELEDETVVIFCDFSDDCFWDQMILKDEMTVVLVKDDNYFWAKRISETEEFGMYGVYI